MLTVKMFKEWLQAFHYTGTVHWANVTHQITQDDLLYYVRECDAHPAEIQTMINQGDCRDGKEALAYLKHLRDVVSVNYSSYY